MAKKSNAKLAVVPVEPKEVKLDIGCGKNKKEGFIGIDQYKMDGVDVVMDVRNRWPYEDDSVDEVHSSHFVEHLTGQERVFFFNELYRVLKPGSKAVIITPHWASGRAYGDFTHAWPPVSEMSFYYLSKKWRDTDAPHTDSRWNIKGYSCDFECTWGYAMRPDLMTRNSEYQQFAMQNYKEACLDTHCTMVKKV
jgi:SAM-dependent methyltransferase